MRRSRQAQDFDAVEAELDDLALCGGLLGTIGAVGRPAHLLARVGHPDKLLAIFVDERDAVALFEPCRPRAQEAPVGPKDHDIGPLRVEAHDIARTCYRQAMVGPPDARLVG